MTEILYCQSPALFLLAVVLLICFFLRRQAHRVRAALDLILCILLLIAAAWCYTIWECTATASPSMTSGRSAPPDGWDWAL